MHNPTQGLYGTSCSKNSVDIKFRKKTNSLVFEILELNSF